MATDLTDPWITKAWALIRLGRPVFLLGGIALHSLGLALARQRGVFDSLAIAVWSQLAVSAIQLMTHYSNDYFDLRTDTANTTPTRWSGGSRVLPSGVLPPIAALLAAIFVGGLAVIAIVALAMYVEHRAVIVLLAVMLVLAWSYSSPPLRLHTRGFGEITVMAVVAIGTPLVGYSAQAGHIDALAMLPCIPLALLQLVMLITIELPDEASDRSTGKRSFVVVFGAAPAVRCARLAIITSYAVLLAFVPAGLPPTVPMAMAMTAPIAAVQLWRMGGTRWREPDAWGRLAFGSVALFFATIVAALLGFVVA